jgi:hypothetical protein
MPVFNQNPPWVCVAFYPVTVDIKIENEWAVIVVDTPDGFAEARVYWKDLLRGVSLALDNAKSTDENEDNDDA